MPLAAGAAGGGRAVDRRAARGHGGDGRGSSPRAGSQGYGDRRAGGDDCRAGGPDRSAGAQAGPRLLELVEAAVTGSPYAKKSTDRSLREKTGRKPGRQPGAPGRTSGLSDDPDETIECAPAECGRCGRDLTGEPAARTERRRRWDITPPPPPYITGYRKITRVCPCCQAASAGQVPADVTSRVVYGPETRAHAANLVSGHHVPVLRAALLLRQMARVWIS